jgi:hypothetical protein
MIDTKNWKITTDLLPEYSKNSWNEDVFFEVSNERYGVYLYNIDEYRMMSYSCILSIFGNKKNILPILNSAKTEIWFSGINTFYFAELSKCLIFRKMELDINMQSKFPFLVIKLEERLYALIDWDFTSIYFGTKEITVDIIQYYGINKNEIKRLKLESRENEIFNLKSLNWFDLDELDCGR